MSGKIPVGSALIMIGLVTGLGYGIMALTTPNEKQFYDSLAPDLKRKVDDSRAYQKAVRDKYDKMEELRLAGEREEPVWADKKEEKK